MSTGRRVAGLVALALAASCAGPTPEPEVASVPATVEPPALDLAPMQRPVVERLERARAAVVASPEAAVAWGMYGAVCDAHELLDCATTCYERARELDAADFRWPYLLAIARERLGEDDAVVVASFEAAAALSPRLPTVHYRLGDALARQGDAERAAGALELAIELDPTLEIGRLRLAQVRLMQGRADAAIELLEGTLARGGRDPRLWATLARARRSIGDEAGAREAAERTRQAGGELALPDPVRFFVTRLGVSTGHRSERPGPRTDP